MKILNKFYRSGIFLAMLLALSVAFSFQSAYADEFPLGFFAQSGAETGTVLLSWNDRPEFSNYNIAYGTQPGVDTYGATNIGKESNYVVGGLTPGVTYYFVISGVVGGQGSRYSPEVSAVAATSTTSAAKGPVSQASFQAPVGGPTADQYQLLASPGQGGGDVKLSWQNPWNANDFHVVYGPQGGGYQWGALNVGHDSNMVTITGLNPGSMYVFAVMADPSTAPQAGLSHPVAQVAK